MLRLEKQTEAFSVSPNNQLEILIDDFPGWTMTIGGKSKEINHKDFGDYLIQEEGFSKYLVFSSEDNTFSSVLLAYVAELGDRINVYIPHPDNQDEEYPDSLFEPPNQPILKKELYEKDNIQLIVNLF